MTEHRDGRPTHQVDRMNEQGDVIHAQANERDAECGHSQRSATDHCENPERRGAEHGEHELWNDDLRAEARRDRPLRGVGHSP